MNFEHSNLFSLLPHTAETQLLCKKQKLNELYLLRSIVDIAINAMENFSQGNLFKFDAQVGENLCQIRAYVITCLWKEISLSFESKKEFVENTNLIKAYKKRLDEVILDWEKAINSACSYTKELDQTENMISFLKRLNLFLPLNGKTIFIITCYFLTHFSIRKENLPIAVNLRLVASQLNISNYKAKKIINLFQTTVCQLGCDFIIKKALTNSNRFFSLYNQETMEQLIQFSDENRAVLPCYIASEIIFYRSIKEKIPLLIRVERKLSPSKVEDTLFFLLCGNTNENGYSLIPCNHSSSGPCMVILAESYIKVSPETYARNFLKNNPLNLLLANMATHPQFSGEKLYQYRDDPFSSMSSFHKKTFNIELHRKRLEAMKQFGLRFGCSKQNSSFFFIKHIYANQVINELNSLNSVSNVFEAFHLLNYEHNLISVNQLSSYHHPIPA